MAELESEFKNKEEAYAKVIELMMNKFGIHIDAMDEDDTKATHAAIDMHWCLRKAHEEHH